VGSFFTNVHACAPESREGHAHQAIVQLLTTDAVAKGMQPCGEDDSPDRSIIVGPAGRWIAIYDEATEDQDLERLDELARAVSVAVEGPAVAALVHDSDQLVMRLFDRGNLVDEIARGENPRGDPARWASLCGSSMDALRKALSRHDLLTEQTLADIAGVLGIDPASACTGYRYLTEEERVGPGSSVLRFRSAVRPAHEQVASGPPRFAMAAWSPTGELPVGGAMHLAASVRNEGGPSRGLLVVVHGKAIEAGLVAPERVQVVVGMPSKGGVVVEQPLVPRTNKNGEPGLAAEYPELDLPAGNAGGMQALAALGPKQMVERMYASNIHVNVHGRGVSAGTGTVIVSLVPLAHREPQFQYHHAIELTVARAARKPLRAETDANAWLALEKPAVLVVLAASTLERREAAAFAAEAFVHWRALWPEDLVLSCAIHERSSVERPVKPRSAKLQVAQLEKGAAWKKLRGAFETAARVSGMYTGATGFEYDRGVAGNGFDFGGYLLSNDGQEDPDLATLRLSVDLRGREGHVAEMVARARSIVDAFVRDARCAQALVARWQTGNVFDGTPYETACGVHQQAPLRKSWGTRFLRGVSADGIWLGPDLLARIDVSALDALVDSERVGEALRVVPRQGVRLDALEQVLAPVLPSGQDWNRWMSWIYDRGPRPT
jgi:hypothetical protein